MRCYIKSIPLSGNIKCQQDKLLRASNNYKIPFLTYVFDCIFQKHMVFHHPGYGGQVGAGIPDLNLGIGYITNYLGCYLDSFDDERVKPLYRAILDSIKKLRNL